ncbi:MAG: hypothetical protein R3E98_05810 [Gemmatimonadota bacterium]
MKRSTTYASGSILAVGLVVLALRPFLDVSTWLGVSLAGATALVTQLLLFLALRGVRKDPKRFAVGIVAGAAARFTLLVGAVVWLVLAPRPWGVAFLFALPAFLVALLLFESILQNLDLLRPRAAHS